MRINTIEDNILMIPNSNDSKEKIIQNKKEENNFYQKIPNITSNNFQNINDDDCKNNEKIKNYKQYNNISEINNRGIKQPESNVFIISTGFYFHAFPFIFFILGILFFVLMIIIIKNSDYLEIKVFFFFTNLNSFYWNLNYNVL